MTLQEQAEKLIDIPVQDIGVVGYILCIEQLTWIFHLKYLDCKVIGRQPDSLNIEIDEVYRWSNWACPKLADGSVDNQNTKSDDDLIEFVNGKLFPYFRDLSLKLTADENSPQNSIFSELIFMFQTVDNRFISGYHLRKLLNLVDELEIDSNSEFSEFAQVYGLLVQKIAKEVPYNYGFYTPWPLIRAIVSVINPVLGESVYDAASGTCDFLLESLKHMKLHGIESSDEQWKSLPTDKFLGREKDPFADLLGRTNMIFHVDQQPNTLLDNPLSHDVRKFTEKDRFDIVLTNIPFEDKVEDVFLKNFQIEYNSEVLLYVQHVMNSLKSGGRAAVIVPDEILESAVTEFKQLRQELLESFNLHSILSLPAAIFWPYTHIKSSVLFFNHSKRTSNIWYYECDLNLKPYKNTEVFDENFEEFVKLFSSRELTKNSWKVPFSEIDENFTLRPKNPNRAAEKPTLNEDQVSAKKDQLIRSLKVYNSDLIRRLDTWFENVSSRRTIDDVAIVKAGSGIPKGENKLDERTNHPFVQISDFTDQGSLSSEKLKYLTDGAYDKVKSKAISNNELCVSLMETVGKVCIVPEELEGAILTENAATIKIKDKNDLNLRYLYLFALTNDFKTQISNATDTIDQPKLEISNLKTIEIPVCSFYRQLEIANKVWKLKTDIEEAEKQIHERKLVNIEDFDELIEKLDKISRSIVELELPSVEFSNSTRLNTVNKNLDFNLSVKSHFATLMLTNERILDFLGGSIQKMKFQGMIDGYSSDDLILYANDPETRGDYKAICHIKEKIEFTEENSTFVEVFYAAWMDLNNSDVFNRGKDAIVLITEPIDPRIKKYVQFLTSFAKSCDGGATEYFRIVRNSNFGYAEISELIGIFESRLKLSKNGMKPTDEELYDFFKHFHIIEYDYDTRIENVYSLLHAHKPKFVDDKNSQNFRPELIYSRVIAEVKSCNQDGRALTNENLTNEVHSELKAAQEMTGSPEKSIESMEKVENTWKNQTALQSLSLLALIGSWSGNNEKVKKLLAEFIGMKYEELLKMVSEVSHFSDSPISIEDGIWRVSNRQVLIDSIEEDVLEQKLEEFQEVALEVLNEEDTTEGDTTVQDLTVGSGYENLHSFSIRKGISEGLAILGNSETLLNMSDSATKNVPQKVVQLLLEEANWRKWSALNKELPELAEAAPVEFLTQVDNALNSEQNPFQEIYARESSEYHSVIYSSGLIQALEILAWDEQYLEKACLCLCRLNRICPMDNSSNSPIVSLIKIFLPWLPQTNATSEDRKVVISNIVEEYNDVGWELLIGLLPDQTIMPTGTSKPKWQKVVIDDEENKVTNDEYTDQIKFVAELAVWESRTNSGRIVDLVKILDVLPISQFIKFAELLSSNEVKSLPNGDVKEIWEQLLQFISKHRQFSDADWSLADDALTRLEEIAENLKPEDPFWYNQRLFSNEIHLSENLDSFEEQEKVQCQKRERAIEELLNKYENDINKVLEFASAVEAPHLVGFSLASHANDQFDKVVISDCLQSEESRKLRFAGAYIRERQRIKGWKWVDSILNSPWLINATKDGSFDNDSYKKFFSNLPVGKEHWERARARVGSDGEYWSIFSANIYKSKSTDFEFAIESLIKFNHPKIAILCLDKMKRNEKVIENDQCVKALLGAAQSKETKPPFYHLTVINLIKHLQEKGLDREILSEIEWAYLDFLDGHKDSYPKTLNERLSTEPEFFCKIIKLAYKSAYHDKQQEKLEQNEETESSNAAKLLQQWAKNPGATYNGGFHSTKFNNWYKQVRKISESSGHIEMALYTIGKMFSKLPKDSDGFWINRSVADVLENDDSKDLREGFIIGKLDEYKVVRFDPTGISYLGKSAAFRDLAEKTQKEGYGNLAGTFLEISKNFKSYAEANFSSYFATK